MVPSSTPTSSPAGKLAAWGAILFAAASPVSYAAAQWFAGLALLALLVGFATRTLRYRPSPLDLPLLAFVAAEILSIVFSVHPARSLRCLRGDWILLFYPVFAQSLRGARDVRRAYAALLASSSLVGLYAIWQMFDGRDLLRDRALEAIGPLFIATGFFGHHLTYGGHVLITSTLALVLTVARPRASRLLACAAQVGGVVASFARTAWVGLGAGVCALSASARGRTRIALAGSLVAAAVVAVAIPPLRERLGDLLSFHDDPRIRLWQTAIRIWLDHPIFGAGLGSFKTQFPIYQVPGYYMATGHPHNDLLNILVHSGIIGLAAFVWIWVRYFRAISAARRSARPEEPRGDLLAAAWIVPLAFFVGGLGQCFLTDEEVGTLFWFIAAASIAVARETNDAKA